MFVPDKDIGFYSYLNGLIITQEVFLSFNQSEVRQIKKE